MNKFIIFRIKGIEEHYINLSNITKIIFKDNEINVCILSKEYYKYSNDDLIYPKDASALKVFLLND